MDERWGAGDLGADPAVTPGSEPHAAGPASTLGALPQALALAQALSPRPFPARLERFGRVASTQSIVAGWLAAGEPEVCVAVADEQTAGRGRHGRAWTAPPGAALLLSVGFRPGWLPASGAWKLAAIVALAMTDAAEDVAGLRDGRLGLKWPNDIVAPDPDGGLRKVAGVLGESTVADGGLQTVVVGIGVNVQWSAADFPPDLAGGMSSLSEVSAGRPVDRDALLAGFLDRLEPRLEALRGGRFDAGGWDRRQQTTGRQVAVEVGGREIEGIGEGVDQGTGALLVRTGEGIVPVDAGEVVRCRVG